MDRDGGLLHHRSVVSFSLKPKQLSGLIAESASRWNSHNAPRLGAALAFYTLLSVAPLLGLLATIGSLFFGSVRTRSEIVRQVYSVAGPAGAKVVSSILGITPGAQHGILAAVSGILILFFGASAVLIELRDALNLMWDIPVSNRTPLEDMVQLVRERLFAFVVVLLIGFFLLVSMTVDVIASALVHTVSRLPVEALHLGAAAVSFRGNHRTLCGYFPVHSGFAAGMDGRAFGSAGDLSALYGGQVCDRVLSDACGLRHVVRECRFEYGAAGMGLLLQPDIFLRRRLHKGVCGHVRIAAGLRVAVRWC